MIAPRQEAVIAELREEMQKLSSYTEAKQRMEAMQALDDGGKGAQVKPSKGVVYIFPLSLFFAGGRALNAACQEIKAKVSFLLLAFLLVGSSSCGYADTIVVLSVRFGTGFGGTRIAAMIRKVLALGQLIVARSRRLSRARFGVDFGQL